MGNTKKEQVRSLTLRPAMPVAKTLWLSGISGYTEGVCDAQTD